APDRVVYVKDIKDLAGISGDPKAGGLTIGAGTRLSDIVDHAGIRESYPALWQATVEVGSVQIRNMSTVGGNLLQRPRCWYFRSGFGLLGMKDGKSMVRAGDNRYHAIFMTDGDALFVSPSSRGVALTPLGGQPKARGTRGEPPVKGDNLSRVPKGEGPSELPPQRGETPPGVTTPAAGKNASYEARQ